MPPRKKRAILEKVEENCGPVAVVASSIQKHTGALPRAQEALLPAKPDPEAWSSKQEAAAQAEDDSKIRRRTYDVHPGGFSGVSRRETFVVRVCPPLVEESSSDFAASDTATHGADSFFVRHAEDSPNGPHEETNAPVNNKKEMAEANMIEKQPRGRKKKGQTFYSPEEQGPKAASEEQPKKRGRKKKAEAVADHSIPAITVAVPTTEEPGQMDCREDNDSAEDLFCPTKEENEPDIPEVKMMTLKPEAAKANDVGKTKKRGRPKKPLEFVGIESAADGVETTVPPKEKSKRGRKKKEQVVEESEELQDNPEKNPLKSKK